MLAPTLPSRRSCSLRAARRRLGTILPLLALLQLLPSGCGAAPDDRVHPVRAQGWVETRLYFGLGPANQPSRGIDEAAWRGFLDREVTPRFPGGLSVVAAYGQWQGPREAAPERLRSRILVIDYPDTAENRGRIEAIRLAWRRLTGDLSVLRVTQPAAVSF